MKGPVQGSLRGKRPGEVTVVAIMRDEGTYLTEWIRHYRAIGADRIVVYDNQSSDHSRAILRAAALAYGNVRMVRWPDREGRSSQRTAYNHALKRCRTEWIAFFDADEFLNPAPHASFGAFLAAMPDDCGAVAVNWLLFGSGGARTREPGDVRERFVRSAPPAHGTNRRFKTVARARCVEDMRIHHAILREGYYADAAGRSIEPMEHPSRTVCTDGPRLHHYVLKSWEEFKYTKTIRPSVAAAATRTGFSTAFPSSRGSADRAGRASSTASTRTRRASW